MLGGRLGRQPRLLGARLGRLGLAVELGGDPTQLVALLENGAVRVRLGHLGAHLGARRLLGRFVARVRLGDLGVADDLGDSLAPDRRQVVGVIGDVLDLEHVEVQAQLGEILLDLRRQRVGELQPILVDLLGRQRGQHAAQVPLQRLLGDLLDVAQATSEESLDRVHDDRPESDDSLMRAMARTLSGMPTLV